MAIASGTCFPMLVAWQEASQPNEKLNGAANRTTRWADSHREAATWNECTNDPSALRNFRDEELAFGAGSLVDAFSRGSMNHHKGMCTPCRYNTSGTPCPNRASCNCCHFSHDPDKVLSVMMHRAMRASQKERKQRLGATSRGPVAQAAGDPSSKQRNVWTSPPMPDSSNASAGDTLRGGMAGASPMPFCQMHAQQLVAILQQAAPDHYED